MKDVLVLKKIRRSVCPYDCPDTCGLLVEVSGGKAIKVTGDPDHPSTRGTLCPKMNRYQDTVHSPLRLTRPLLRQGIKGHGDFRPILWEEAINHITDRWHKIIEQFGAEAILPYSYAGTMGLIQRNAGHPFFYRLGASRLDRTICSPAKEAGWKSVMGETPSPHPDEVAESDLVILWGINAVATNIHFLHGVKLARRRGAKVWLIDTYQNHTSSVVDQTFLVRPGSDGALALGMMHLLVDDNLIDHDFIKTHFQGFEELKERILPDYPPEKVSILTGLSPGTIQSMAKVYGTAERPFIRLGAGLSRYGNGAMTIRTIVSLPALVGAYGKKGAGCFSSTNTSGAFAMKEILREDFMAKETRIINMNRLGSALNELIDPPIRSLYVYHSNPAAVAPDQKAFAAGKAVELSLPLDARTLYRTPSGKIEILNPRESRPLPCYVPPYGGDYPFRLMTAPSFYALNSTFRERAELLKKERAMFLQMNPADAEPKGLKEGQRVIAFNQLGEVSFILRITPNVPSGVVVAEGVWWLEHCPGVCSVNALTSQKLTDQGGGSTFYDNTVDVKPEG